MSNIWVYSLSSVLVVSLISFIGALGLAVSQEKLKKWLLYLVSFSAGALLGDVFLHILPELSENGFTRTTGMFLLLGILVFFFLERVIHWHRSHSDHSEEVHSVVYLTMTGDTLHNFIDGVIIAASYFISIPVGIATTLAVVFHEIPQEIGNFGVLVHGGWSAKKALLYNFFSALSAILGAVVMLLFFGGQPEVPGWLIAMAASSFIYIAMADLIPEIHKETGGKHSVWFMTCMVLGIACMGLLLFLE